MIESLSLIHRTRDPMMKTLLHTTPPFTSRGEEKLQEKTENGTRNSKDQTDKLLPDRQRTMKS